MTIEVERSVANEDGSIAMDSPLRIRVPALHVAEFQELVFRATNLWPDASPAIKEFADKVTSGYVLQDYEKVYRKLSKQS